MTSIKRTLPNAKHHCRRSLLRAALWIALAEAPLAYADPARELPAVTIGTPTAKSNVPDPWRQSVFLRPQAVSAVDVSGDGRTIAVSTMAFRDDRNFWLLSDDGTIVSSRYVEPWAPFQVALPGDGKACAVGLAYSRVTDPAPTVSLFEPAKDQDTALVDAAWDLGWLRYGQGDWRRGWPASMMGDLLVGTREAVFTVASHDGAWRLSADGRRRSYPRVDERPFRMAASGDGQVLVHGFLMPVHGALDEKTKHRLRLPNAIVVARSAATSMVVWTAAPLSDIAPPAEPPEPADEFRELAADFVIRPLTRVPFRAALAVAANGDGSQTAWTEYGGWLRIKEERGIGSWNPDHPVAFCQRQRGWLRVHGAAGEELARAELPEDGLFEIAFDPRGEFVWCFPMSWFARGLAGRAWLPADVESRSVHRFNLARRQWEPAWRFPDSVSDLAPAPDGGAVMVSCWDGNMYLVGRDAQVLAKQDLGECARLRWSADGRFAVAATELGEVWGFDSQGQAIWKRALPQSEPVSVDAAKRVFDDVPIYAVGRVGKEHAYVGDIWLVKAPDGALIVDTAGSSAIPLTWLRMRSAGIDPSDVKFAMLSHSHGDHSGAAYLWRTSGVWIVAPESAALTVNWLMPTWSDYSLWAPAQIDLPLALKRAGDQLDFTLLGLPITAVFVPGHSFDSVIYVMRFGDKSVAFTGDIGFDGESHILHRCWGDREKAAAVAHAVREKVLPLGPDHVLTGHGARAAGTAFLEDLLRRTDDALAKP